MLVSVNTPLFFASRSVKTAFTVMARLDLLPRLGDKGA